MRASLFSLYFYLSCTVFLQVWKAEARDICGCDGPILVAVKTVKETATQKEKAELLREIQIMQMLGPHPNVVTFLGCCSKKGKKNHEKKTKQLV